MSFGKVERGFLPLVVCWFNFQIVHSLLINLHILLRYPTPIFYFLMGPQCVHKHYIPPFSGIYVVVIGKKGGKLRRQILQPSQAIDFQSILIYEFIDVKSNMYTFWPQNVFSFYQHDTVLHKSKLKKQR